MHCVRIPLDYPLALQIPGRELLQGPISDWTKSTSFANSVFSIAGKFAQTLKDGKKFEALGLGVGSAFLVTSFILSFFGDPKEPDPNTELLNSINQTVTATYEAVLQIQDELHTISNQLASLQDLITKEFEALNAAVLSATCTSAFGRLRTLC